ncbi:MAG: APC family permease [Ruminococcus sp.]|nr:APC family permease [Ruminococcus sp.]
MEEGKKKLLGVPELTCYGIGNSIGSGIFVSMGVSIGYTGHSITLALALACVVVLFAYAYKTVMAGMFVLPGGRYSQAALLQPPLLVGASALTTAFSGLAFAMYAISIVEYAATVVPQLAEYDKIIEIAILTLFFVTTFFGDKFMGRFNLIMVVVLIFALLVYTFVGLGRVDWSTVNPASENYFSGGVAGLFMAVATMSFACQGSTLPIDMAGQSRNPKRSLPIAIMLSSLIILVVYCLIGIVSAGILPIEDVAGKNLGVVAKAIFPYPVFVIFIIGGACFAIATSLYSTMAGVRYPILATVDDGWLPKFLGKRTEKGYPWVMMLLLYATSILSIFVDLGLQDLISVMMIPTMILNTINNILVVGLARKYPKAWEKSFFHMPMAAFRVVMGFATFCSLLITAALFTTMDTKGQILIVVLMVAVFGYCAYRLKADKVNLTDIGRAKAEAEKAAMEA